jgi:hypothetical protein
MVNGKARNQSPVRANVLLPSSGLKTRSFVGLAGPHYLSFSVQLQSRVMIKTHPVLAARSHEFRIVVVSSRLVKRSLFPLNMIAGGWSDLFPPEAIS